MRGPLPIYPLFDIGWPCWWGGGGIRAQGALYLPNVESSFKLLDHDSCLTGKTSFSSMEKVLLQSAEHFSKLGKQKILTGYRIKVSAISSGFFQDQEGKILKKSISSVSISYSVQWVSLFRTKNISNDFKDFWVSKVNLLLFKMFIELLHYYFMTQSQWVHYFMVLK